jgi:preprotein translocase subunit SecG
MITFLAIVHIIACFSLIGLVLIQDSKGGGVFTSQSSSNSVLGAGGATTLAQTMTKVIAGVFAATCIGLSIMSASSAKSVVDSMPAAAAIPTPAATPATPSTNSTAGENIPKDPVKQAAPAGQPTNPTK